MSEQTKSNFQMIGAGFMGFVAVVGAAGLLLSQFSGRSAAPQAALSAPESHRASNALSMTASRVTADKPASSPAPMTGYAADDAADQTAVADAAAAAAGVNAADAAVAQQTSLGALGDPRYAGKGETTSNARAEAKNIAAAPKTEPDAKPVPRIKLDKNQARGSIASSVHYGVTSRSELMGRAAGPVYNFTGRSVAGNPRIAELAGSAQGKIADAEKKIDASDLTPEQKREMKQRLQNARESVGK